MAPENAKQRFTMGIVVALMYVGSPVIASAAPGDFVPLFNGKDLAGWHGMPHFDPYKLAAMSETERRQQIEQWTADAKQHWRVQAGELINDGHGAFLTTDRDFEDFELLVEYRTVPKADSGIYLRGCPQVQIWDSTEEAKFKHGANKGSGGLWNNSPGAPGKDPLRHADKPFGEWNRLRIIQVGERVTVYLNEQLVVDHARMENFWNRKLPLPRTGPIQLQTHGGEIRWRNIKVREIPPAEANEILAKRHADRFEDIFNGKDFNGWQGPTENYRIVNGSMICEPKKGGTIFTKDVYSDFTVRLEFQLEPGGNNGLALRYPGQSDAAYEGMCEIQILDDNSPKYKNLDSRQFAGSAYGMVAAHRGYLRPAGQWNFMEVTARRSALVVELNGTRILDADLSKVDDYLGGKPHPGKDRAFGHFGLCGHADPVAVAFRYIRIQRHDGMK